MPYIVVGNENSGDIELYYEDHGSQPRRADPWVPAELRLVGKTGSGASGAGLPGHHLRPARVRKSGQPTSGYNYDTFAEDLHKLVTHLQLQNFALVGFSMGGGEVARYISKYGSNAVSKAVIISGVPPFLLKTADNPEGVEGSVFAAIEKAIAADRYAFFTEFFKNFYNTDAFLGKRISEEAVQASWNVAAGSSATASRACVATWHVDFRADLGRINVPRW